LVWRIRAVRHAARHREQAQPGLHKAVANADLVKRLDAVGIETRTSTPEELGRFVRSESARFGKVIRSAGIKPI
jgi:tripartite-type tricarboxylate transporter receptor subunit TctC